jgi:predicted DNA-binding transcriptional regulator YafY
LATVESATAKLRRVLPRTLASQLDALVAAHVLEAVSGASYRHAISVRVQGSERAVQRRMPGSIAGIEPIDEEPGWVRVRWRAEWLDWVPSVLAGLGLPFIIEEPEELRARVRALAHGSHRGPKPNDRRTQGRQAWNKQLSRGTGLGSEALRRADLGTAYS